MIALRTEQHTEDTAVHFHFRYGGTSVETLVSDPSMAMWMATVFKSGTTEEQVKKQLAAVINELP